MARDAGEVELQARISNEGGRPVAAAIELGILDKGIYALGGEGLTGLEPAFRFLSQATTGSMSSALISQHFAALANDEAAQNAMAFWLATAGLNSSRRVPSRRP